jgi:hypothetical protein
VIVSAHVGGMPVEELIPTAISAGTALLVARTWLSAPATPSTEGPARTPAGPTSATRRVARRRARPQQPRRPTAHARVRSPSARSVARLAAATAARPPINDSATFERVALPDSRPCGDLTACLRPSTCPSSSSGPAHSEATNTSRTSLVSRPGRAGHGTLSTAAEERARIGHRKVHHSRRATTLPEQSRLCPPPTE